MVPSDTETPRRAGSDDAPRGAGDPARGDASRDAGEEARGVELWLAPFFRDSTLWPVLAVAVAIFVLLGAWVLLRVFVDRSLFAVGALLPLFFMSVDVLIRSRRGGGSGLLIGCIAGFWVLSVAAAVGARLSGWY